MFGFFQVIVEKFAIAVAGLVAAVGLATPSTHFERTVPEATTTPPITVSTTTATTTQESTTVNTETLLEIEKIRLELEKERNERLRLEVKLNVESKEESAAEKPPTPQVTQEQPKQSTFKTPSGAILDENGNILNPIEVQSRLDESAIRQAEEEAVRQKKLQEEAESQKLQQATALEALVLKQQIAAYEKVNAIKDQLWAKKQEYLDTENEYYDELDKLHESWKGRGITTSSANMQEASLTREYQEKLDKISREYDQLKFDYDRALAEAQSI
jgi:hypothetical protein